MKRQYIYSFLVLLMSMISIHMSAQDEIYSQNSDGIWLRYEPIGLTTNVVAYRDDTHDVSYYTGNLTIPASFTEGNETYYVEQIGNFAFSNCSSLTSVSIPSSVTYINRSAFLGCSGLTSVQISDVAAWCKISFVDDKANPLYYARHLYLGKNEIKDLVVPNSVTSIRGHAFYRCSGLTSVTIPNSVTSIGTKAFSNCSNLTSVTIKSTTPPNVYSDSFEGITNSATLYVPAGSKAAYEANSVWSKFSKIEELISFSYSNVKALCIANWDTNGDGELSVSEAAAVTTLGNVFKDNTDIVSFNELRYFTGLTSIGNSAFSGCTSLTSVTMPSSVTSIGDYAYYGCSSLTSIVIPNAVTSIGDRAFYNCSKMTDVTIPNSVENIYRSAFGAGSGYKINIRISDLEAWNNIKFDENWGCPFYLYLNGEKVDELVIPNTITKIGDYAFKYCKLTSVEIPNSVTNIGMGAFYYCTSLTSIDIPNSVTTIGKYAFSHCTSLTSVDIPNSVTTIKEYTFSWCENLPSVTIPNSVETIETYAFYNCYRLMNISIGSSVSSIGELALATGCTLDGLIMTVGMETPVSVGQLDLPNNKSYGTLYVPVGCKAAYEAADYWKNFGTIVEMGNDITISSAGMGTFCSTHPLDFSGTDDIKAYIVSAFKPSTGEVTLTRITDVPANTGIVVKGDANTYAIPWGPGETVVANMLVGVTEDTQLNKVDGDYTNYILAKKSGNLGFYAVTDGSTLSAGKAYLPLPTNQLPAGARQMTMIFDDETTGVQQIQSNVKSNGEYYDLQGRRVLTPTRGLYIVNGKKVVIK